MEAIITLIFIFGVDTYVPSNHYETIKDCHTARQEVIDNFLNLTYEGKALVGVTCVDTIKITGKHI